MMEAAMLRKRQEKMEVKLVGITGDEDGKEDYFLFILFCDTNDNTDFNMWRVTHQTTSLFYITSIIGCG